MRNRMGAVALTAVAVLFFVLERSVAGAEVGRGLEGIKEKIGIGGTEKELEGIKEKIVRERRGITEVRSKEISVLQSLETIERELEQGNRDLERIGAKLEDILLDLQKSEREVESIESSLRGRREFFKKRARALYKWQRGGSPFVLLNGAFSVADLMRRKRYLGSMLALDQNLIRHLIRESLRRKSLEKDLSRKREDLDRERSDLVRVRGLIRSEKEKKRELLARLQREKEMRVRVLEELEQAALRLERVMDEIGRDSTVEPPKGHPEVDFAKLRGKMDYPVPGEVVGGFGKAKHPEFPAQIFRKGIDIKAPLGEAIRAVGRGRIIYSARFEGYGKMLIIDHGERYYTVYAHLSELFKNTGETVRMGETIALVGGTGSLRGTGLYFEIRKDGKPVDPLPWFRGQ